jgi:HTH-type transcriptional regulator/antitoxin HigA
MISTEADFDWALKEIEPYFDVELELGTEAGRRFEMLSKLIEEYEDKHWAIEPPDSGLKRRMMSRRA